MLAELTDNDELSALEEGTVILDFYATWCAPCKAMSPILYEAADQLKDVEFYQVNVEKNPDLVAKFEVSSMPTFIKLVNGVEDSRMIGAGARETFREFVES